MAVAADRSRRPAETGRAALMARFASVRARTERLAAPLEREDMVVQTCDDVSPAKWHLAHTSWFFETVLLKDFDPAHRPFHPAFNFLFNSYYESFGDRWDRPRRGVLSRPTVEEVFRYRASVDERMARLARAVPDERWAEFARLTGIGLHHEEQHQELMLMDIKHVFGVNPLKPAYRAAPDGDGHRASAPPAAYRSFHGGLIEIGHDGDGFAWDNEKPRHRRFLEDFRLADRPVTNGDVLEFIRSGGYGDARLWLSDGWDARRRFGWEAPLYWERDGSEWTVMTLRGLRPLNPAEPVCHVSFYEADAFARWAGRRLPTEAEWERAASLAGARADVGNFLESDELHPRPAPSSGTEMTALLGDVWEWTASAYEPYPGFVAETGALAEYNGKFMANQMVLRGGCCVTPRDHIRTTYRNFFQPDKRWPFTGFRLAAKA